MKKVQSTTIMVEVLDFTIQKGYLFKVTTDFVICTFFYIDMFVSKIFLDHQIWKVINDL